MTKTNKYWKCWKESVKKSLTFSLICVYDVIWSSTNDKRQYLVVCGWIFYLIIIQTKMSEGSQSLLKLNSNYSSCKPNTLMNNSEMRAKCLWLSQKNITFADQRKQ